jgi:TonB family protein
VRSLIDAQKHYPEEARRARTQGTAVVAFVVSPTGEFRDLRIVSADDSILGTAALRALKQAARHIGPPPTGTAIPMEIALRFELATERQ